MDHAKKNFNDSDIAPALINVSTATYYPWVGHWAQKETGEPEEPPF